MVNNLEKKKKAIKKKKKKKKVVVKVGFSFSLFFSFTCFADWLVWSR